LRPTTEGVPCASKKLNFGSPRASLVVASLITSICVRQSWNWLLVCGRVRPGVLTARGWVPSMERCSRFGLSGMSGPCLSTKWAFNPGLLLFKSTSNLRTQSSALVSTFCRISACRSWAERLPYFWRNTAPGLSSDAVLAPTI